ncbi:hypothetical protein HRI_003531300 [Hibiscus trionum]|uniref:Uncharacterized protein n=1 Tax=Hibiscus trionum TaxID=183268 RepID=A0A9W7INX9_HIBTR|nr:hypothetical protein HRI_003531300 [Hibiscus trionum]
MPAAESLKSDPIPMAAAPWPTVMKNPPNDGDELMKPKKHAFEMNKPGLEAKKVISFSCICSPTSHAGSFRCHLHRTSCTAGSKPQGGGGFGGQEPVLSRFGRACSKPISDSSLSGY